MSENEEVTIKTNEEKNVDVSHNTNFLYLTHTFILLLGPILMGVAINAIGNEKHIRINFVKIHGYQYNNTTGPTSNDLPSTIWSLGFLFPFGGLFGSLFGSYSVDRYGRKWPSFLFVAFIIFGGIMKLLSKNYSIGILFFGRFLDGFGSSGFLVSGIIWLFECLPEKIGGYIKPFIQIGVNVGILIMSILLLNHVSGEYWEYSYIYTIIIGGILLVAIGFHPESPNYVYRTTKDADITEKILRRLRKTEYDAKELEALKMNEEAAAGIKQVDILTLVKNKNFLLSNISLIVLHIGQQLCGINAIVSFSPAIFEKANIPNSDIGAMIVTLVGLICSIIFAPLVGNKKRKMLWLIGFGSMLAVTVGFLINGACEGPGGVSVFMLSAFVGMFQIGPGPVVWFISLEMYPSYATGAAQGVASFFNWFANTIVYLLTPILIAVIGKNTLIIFAVIQILVIIYSVFFVVETYGKPIDTIQAEYRSIQIRICPKTYSNINDHA